MTPSSRYLTRRPLQKLQIGISEMLNTRSNVLHSLMVVPSSLAIDIRMQRVQLITLSWIVIRMWHLINLFSNVFWCRITSYSNVLWCSLMYTRLSIYHGTTFELSVTIKFNIVRCILMYMLSLFHICMTLEVNVTLWVCIIRCI